MSTTDIVAPATEKAGPPPPSYTEAKSQPMDVPPPQQPIQQQPYPPHEQELKQPIPNGAKFQQAYPLHTLTQGSVPVDCPACGKRELTKCDYVSGSTTHLSALLLCVTVCLGCIPYLARAFKDVEHRCGNCGALLAVWHRSGRTQVMCHA